MSKDRDLKRPRFDNNRSQLNATDFQDERYDLVELKLEIKVFYNLIINYPKAFFYFLRLQTMVVSFQDVG